MANFPPYQGAYPGAPNQNPYGYQQPQYQMPPQAPQFQPNPVPQMMPQQPMPNTRPSYICYPVGSLEEAVASRVEAFDPPHIMLDFSHNQVYYKKFNQQTGGSDFATFKRVENNEQPQSAPAMPDYEAIAQNLSSRLDGVDEKLTNLLDIFGKVKTPRTTASKGAVKE